MPGALPAGSDGAALEREVTRVLEVLPARSAAVLGVSGGPDSAGLAALVQAARADLRLVAVHVRHGLRDDAPDASAAAGIADALGLPCEVVAVTVTRGRVGVEAAARDARHAALWEVAGRVGARAVLLGHTADDQAETVLLAIGRGTGLRGLGGMRPVRPERPGAGLVVRPLLRMRRADVRAVAENRGLHCVSDPTNTDPDQRRARVRATLLPALTALSALSGGPGDAVAVLTRLAALARDDEALLHDLAATEAVRLLRSWGPVRALRAEALRELPIAMQCRVVRALLVEVRPGAVGLDAASVERVLALSGVGGSGRGTEVAGGVRVTANAGWIAAAPSELADLPGRPLAVPGAVRLVELGLVLLADVADGDRTARGPDAQPDELDVLPPRARSAPALTGTACATLAPPSGPGLVVRARRVGDKVPGSSKSLGDRLTDLGVPRAARGLVPVVALAGDHGPVVWVPGVAAPAQAPPGAVAIRLRLVRQDVGAGATPTRDE